MNFFNNKTKKEEPQKPSAQEEGDVPAQAGAAAVSPAPTSSTLYPQRDKRILNSTQLQRVKDAKRLAETKLNGLEESLARLQAQQRWLRRYNETRISLEREKKRLFELGKQKAILASDASMLERYDSFETIHGTYQRLSVVNEQIGFDKRGLSELEREAEENRNKMTDQEKRLQQASEQFQAVNTSFPDILDNVCLAFHMTGSSEAHDAEAAFLNNHINNINEEIEAQTSVIAETERNIGTLRQELEELYAWRQNMEMHESMLQHGEAILLRLGAMQEISEQRSQLQQKRQQALKRQDEENEMLSRTFAQYQDLLSQIKTTEAELSIHRSYIHDQDGFTLQERAMMLRSRRQMFASALSLWKRISTGYDNIEEKSRRVTALRLHIQHLEDGVRQLEAEAGKVQRLCKEKEYTYLLSKGQDIIQLRADLREGTSCSVCGATHHPYHSDTILEQSKLIGQMKTDFELLASEANAKQHQLSDLQTELATAKGQLQAEEEALNSFRIRQNEDVQEWKLYAGLDHTFADCSESTNHEARTATLRQFIENVSRDAETAQKELETFTFHQGSIAQLSEKLQKFEQRKSEMNVRLNELNTGLQVLSREVEQTTTRYESVNKHFTRVYEGLLSAVTIKDWFTLWQSSPKQLCGQIQQLITDWHSAQKEIAKKQKALEMESVRLEHMKAMLLTSQQASTQVSKRLEDVVTRRAELQKSYRQIVSENDAKDLLRKFIQQVRTTYDKFDEERRQMESIRQEDNIMQGRHDYYLSHLARLEDEQSRLRQKLDLWMHNFNQQNPPVQQGELDKVFADDKDWSRIRSTLNQISTDMLLCQAKVDDLNSRIIALDTEDGHCSPDTPEVQESIAENLQALTRQRNETMMTIARLSVQLEDHERALAAERNSAEPLNIGH